MTILRQLVWHFRSLLAFKKYLFITFFFSIITLCVVVIKDGNHIVCQKDDLVLRNNQEVSLPPKALEKLKQRWLAEQQQHNPKVVGDEPPNSDSKAQAVSSVECLINDDYPIKCLRSNEPSDDVYMPFSFLKQYFDITGKMKHYDGYDRFEFSQSYSKVFSQPSVAYNYHGMFMTFDGYNVEVRDRVKCISGKEGVPVSTQWSQHEYYYSIQISQFGLSHYCKNLKEKPSRSTIYENAEKGIQSKWKTSNRYCVVSTTTDDTVPGKVVKFSTPESIPLGSGVTLTLGNTVEHELSFDIKFVSNGSVSVVLDTSAKTKQYTVHYVTTSVLIDSDHRSNIFYGLGPSRTWRHISRDLLVDLRKGISFANQAKKSKVNIHKVSRLIIRGEGFIDNITISKSAHITHFRDASNWIVKYQDQTSGGWKNNVERRFNEGFATLAPGWISAMGQGQAMSLLARAYYSFYNELYIKSMSLALKPYTVPSERGGVRAVFMNKYVWYEEYPTIPSSFVLNGFIYSVIGLYDFKSLLEDQFKLNDSSPSAGVIQRFSKVGVDLQSTYKLVCKLYHEGMTSLKAMLPLYDGGTRTFYDLRHFILKTQPNIARWDYHSTHLSQLALLSTVSDDPIFKRYFDYWVGYMKGKTAPHN